MATVFSVEDFLTKNTVLLMLIFFFFLWCYFISTGNFQFPAANTSKSFFHTKSCFINKYFWITLTCIIGAFWQNPLIFRIKVELKHSLKILKNFPWWKPTTSEKKSSKKISFFSLPMWNKMWHVPFTYSKQRKTYLVSFATTKRSLWKNKRNMGWLFWIFMQ